MSGELVAVGVDRGGVNLDGHLAARHVSTGEGQPAPEGLEAPGVGGGDLRADELDAAVGLIKGDLAGAQGRRWGRGRGDRGGKLPRLRCPGGGRRVGGLGDALRGVGAADDEGEAGEHTQRGDGS